MAVMATALPARRASRTISWKEAGREGEEGRGGGEEKEEEWRSMGEEERDGWREVIDGVAMEVTMRVR